MSSQLPNDLVPLIESLVDGTIDDAGFDRLNTILADSAEARAIYRRYMNLQTVLPGIVGQSPRLSVQLADVGEEELPLDTHEMPQAQLISLLLQLEATGKDIDPTSLESDPSDITLEDDPGSISRHDMIAAGSYLLRHSLTPKVVAVLATAAALLLGVTLMILLSGNEPQQQPVVISTDVPDESTPVMEVVATLTAAKNARWAEGDLSPGSELFPNQRLTLTAGFAEITTNDGAIAILQAPATVEMIDSPNAIRLHAGKLVGICETELSQGFTVRTPHMDIIDLGTEFGVEVRGQQVTATVFTGEIELETPGQATQPLVANQTATLDAGVGARIVVQERVAEGFTLRLPRTTSAELIQSTAKPIAAWDFHGSNPESGPGIHSGDASTPSGLQMTGFVGPWGTMPASQGAVIIGGNHSDKTEVGEATGVSNGITLRWAVDGVGATSWAYQAGSLRGLPSGHALFGDYYYINRKGDRWGGSAIPWRIEGLTPGARYDIIFFGTRSHRQNGAHIAIEGHDAGNGIGQAATLDLENDGNFRGVVADEQGQITGTFGNPGDAEAQVAGVQIGLLPEAESPNQRINETPR